MKKNRNINSIGAAWWRFAVSARRVKALQALSEANVESPDLTRGSDSSKVCSHSDPYRVDGVPCDASGSPRHETNAIAGHVSAGDETNNFLYYWFSPAYDDRKKADTPVVIWLNGGPGASSLAGLFWENGPFTLDGTGKVNPSACPWNASVHMLYWDNPVGSGYSYNTKNSSNAYVTNEREMARQFVNALHEFYKRHPEYAGNPLYLAGESYAGKYIPFIALEIIYRNMMRVGTFIRLKGLAIGDGWMVPALQCRDQVNYASMIGVLDTLQQKMALYICDNINSFIEKGDYKSAKAYDDKLMKMIVDCGGGVNLYDIREFGDIDISILEKYLNSAPVKACFNVPAQVQWQCADESGPVAEALESDIMQSVADLIPLLVDFPVTAQAIIEWHDKKAVESDLDLQIEGGIYKILFYTGAFDLSCGFMGTERLLNSMKWKGQNSWKNLPRKIWYKPEAQGRNVTQGYIKKFANLTQIEIPDAGHMIPLSQPAINRDMIYLWIEGREFPAYDPLAKA